MRHAWRRLAGDRLFAAVVVLTLGLGIGATTAMFSVTYSVLLRPLPFPAPERLVAIAHLFEGRPVVMSPPNFLDATSGSRDLAAAGAWNVTGATLTGDGDAVRVSGAEVTPGFFRSSESRRSPAGPSTNATRRAPLARSSSATACGANGSAATHRLSAGRFSSTPSHGKSSASCRPGSPSRKLPRSGDRSTRRRRLLRTIAAPGISVRSDACDPA